MVVPSDKKISLNSAILRSRNSLNFIRFTLAALVIFGHAFPLVEGRNDRLEFLAGMAVNLFFCISGFLILASAQRVSLPSYIWRRFLRIFPAYWVSMLFVVCVGVPIAYLLGASTFIWNTQENLNYITSNFDLYKLQFNIPGTLESNPNIAWNSSAWTLWFEFVAYLCLIPFVYLPWVQKYQKVTVTLAFALSLFMYPLLAAVDATTNMYWSFARLVPLFLAGSLLYVWGEYIKVRRLPIITASVATVALHWWNPEVLMNISQVLFAYGVLGFAAVLKVYWGYKNDLSYGVYIYAFPVQQLLVAAGSSELGIALNSVLTLLITMGLAYLSWNLVEKPAMRAKSLLPVKSLA